MRMIKLCMLEVNILKAYKPKHKEMTSNKANMAEIDDQQTSHVIK